MNRGREEYVCYLMHFTQFQVCKNWWYLLHICRSQLVLLIYIILANYHLIITMSRFFLEILHMLILDMLIYILDIYAITFYSCLRDEEKTLLKITQLMKKMER
jgi:hypothetical protein